MLRKNFFLGVISMIILGLSLSSCSEEKKEELIPDTPDFSVKEYIVGEWLLASSDVNEWTTYEFMSSGQMSSVWYSNETQESGLGSYFTNDNTASISGTIAKDQNNYISIDWIVKSAKLFQLEIEIYGNNGNQLIQKTSIYKILTETELEVGSSMTPNYRNYTGSNNSSEFTALNSEIITVNSSTGEIQALKPGKTFVTFKTERGYAAIEISVTGKPLSLKENILGTWITDNIGYIWERDIFGPDNYFYSNWSREVIYPTDNESAQGTYSINEKDMTISVSARTPYSQVLNPEYRILEMHKFDFYTEIYSNGDKVGEFNYQRMLESINLDKGNKTLPEYENLAEGIEVKGYKSHDESVATVNSENGEIYAVGPGITYIDVITPQGTAVIEVNVPTPAIPFDFASCLGKDVDYVKKVLGDNAFLETSSMIAYQGLATTIDLVVASLTDEGKVRGISITFNDNANIADITKTLEADYYPYVEKSTDTYKAYFNGKTLQESTIGVTWNIETLALTYVNIGK